MIQFTAEDIKSFKFEVESETTDDGDLLYEGILTIHFMDGTSENVELTWVREGHLDDFLRGDKEALVEYLNDYEVEA